ncbi:hypothetical protein [Bacillus sp. CGMCC 1.16541]|uniref:hypothetical protein n=1 Tax=Bacillus sp. CGMCC 1.16541 TaxID=2185143 RepID=UPI000D733CB7|nr:hypothetical protein [Bacillus sp. CGMCC 1.16541]
MNRKLIIACISVLVFTISAGCLPRLNNHFTVLQASALSMPITIGVVGEEPDVEVSGVTMKVIALDELIMEQSLSLDAILITAEQVNEAEKPKYAQFFATVKIPVFYVGVNQPYYTKSDQSLIYSNQPTSDDVTYAYGRMKKSSSTFETWGFKAKNEKELNNLYKDIFRLVQQKKSQTNRS